MEDSFLEIDTKQIGGVDSTLRKTTARLAARARLTVHERILTEKEETAKTYFTVSMDGEDSAVDLISRSVAKGASRRNTTPASWETAAAADIPNVTRSWLTGAR